MTVSYRYTVECRTVYCHPTSVYRPPEQSDIRRVPPVLVIYMLNLSTPKELPAIRISFIRMQPRVRVCRLKSGGEARPAAADAHATMPGQCGVPLSSLSVCAGTGVHVQLCGVDGSVY